MNTTEEFKVYPPSVIEYISQYNQIRFMRKRVESQVEKFFWKRLMPAFGIFMGAHIAWFLIKQFKQL